MVKRERPAIRLFGENGQLVQMCLLTWNGLELFTKDLTVITQRERNRIICRFLIWAEEIGVSQEQLNRAYDSMRTGIYESKSRPVDKAPRQD